MGGTRTLSEATLGVAMKPIGASCYMSRSQRCPVSSGAILGPIT